MLRPLFEITRHTIPFLLSGWALLLAIACSSSGTSGAAASLGGSVGEGQGGAAGNAATTGAHDSSPGGTGAVNTGGAPGASGGSITSSGTNSTVVAQGGGAAGSSSISDTGGSAGAAQGGVATVGSSASNAGSSPAAGQGGGAAGGSSASNTGGSAGSAQGGNTTGTPSLWSLAPASPALSVSFTTEDTARVIQDVPLTGGVIKTQSQDGTVFELTIPNNALISPETIAMTPVHLQTQPFGDGPAWGVQLLPDGLVFNAPLKLVITPPAGQAPPVGQQVPFGWSGAANEVLLAYADPAASGLTLQIFHFSSYAYAVATQGMSASLAGVRNRIGGTAEARIQSAMAERLSMMRQAALLGVSEGGLIDDAEVQALMLQYENEVVKVRIAAAGTSCAAGRLAIETYLGFERQRQLLGSADGSWADTMGSLIDTVTNECLDEEWALCRDQHIVQRIVPVYLGMERQSQLLGVDTTGKAWEAKALDYITKCHKYRLDVDSKAGTVCDQWTFSEPVIGQVKLQLDAAPLGTIRGSGVLASMSYSIHYTDTCTGVANIIQLDPTFDVQSLGWQLKTDPTAPGKGEIRDFIMPYSPGMPSPGVFGSTHQVTDPCGDPPNPPQTIAEFNWWSVYVIAMGLNPKYFSETSGWFFKDWTVYNDGGAVLAKKTVDEPYNDGSINWTAPTSLALTHTPG